MSNLPQNSSYGNAGVTPTIPGGFRYAPRSNWGNLAQLPATPTPAPNTPEDYQRQQTDYLRGLRTMNEGKGLPNEQRAYVPPGDPKAPIPLPSDYGTFQSPMKITTNGENLSWGTPKTPVIRNVMGGDAAGQYVEDSSDPALLVKTNRGSNPQVDDAVRSGRLGAMNVIDHIMPLALGGADTLANRQRLTYGQNRQKTIAQSIPYTLYAYGDISLSEARGMAMQWKERDLTDIPKPNGVGLVSDVPNGKTGIEIAREVATRWSKPKKVGFKDVMAALPETVKEFFGKDSKELKGLPQAAKIFMGSAASGATMGFVPYEVEVSYPDTRTEAEIEQNKLNPGLYPDKRTTLEKAQGVIERTTGILGATIGSFILPIAAATKMLAGMGWLAGGARAAFGVKRIQAAVQVTKAFESTAEVTSRGFTTYKAARVAGAVEKVASMPKTLSGIPSYVQRVLGNPEILHQATSFAAVTAITGQGHQFVQNKFNPEILSGQAYTQEQESVIANVAKDLAYGAVTGIAGPTLKGTAQSIIVPTMLSLWADPDNPEAAITNGLVFGLMHAHGVSKRPGYNDVKMFGGKKYIDPVTQAQNDMVKRMAFSTANTYNPELFPEFSVGKAVPKYTDKAMLEREMWSAIGKVVAGRTELENLTPQQRKAETKKLKDYGFAQTQKLDVAGEIPQPGFIGRKINSLSKLPGSSLFSRFSSLSRKTATAAKADVKKEFGLGYESRIEPMAGETLDLASTRAEIKRIVVAFRELYKDGLPPAMREQSDLDDLLSYGKMVRDGKKIENIKNRADSSIKFVSPDDYVNPPSVRQAVEAFSKMKPDFMEMSFGNEGVNPSTKFLNGTIDIPGLALMKSTPKYQYLFDSNGDFLPGVSPNIILKLRPDTAHYWRMQNKALTLEQVKSGDRVPDLNPENAIQAFMLVKNPKTGGIEIVEVGFVAGENHLSKINSHPGVKEYVATGGAKGMKPIDFNKNQLAEVMKKNGIDQLVVNLDKLATGQTKETGNPFIVGNLRDSNWTASLEVAGKLAQEPTQTSVPEAIANVNNALKSKKTAEQASRDIATMQEVVVKPASAYPEIPQSAGPVIKQHAEMVREVTTFLEGSLEVANPVQVKEAFKKIFDVTLTDTQAAEMFARRDKLTKIEGLNMLAEIANSGDSSGMNAASKIKLQLIKTYIESGALHASEGGRASLNMLLLGKMKNTGLRGQEEHVVGNPTSVLETPTVSNTQEPVTQPAVTQDTNIPTRVKTDKGELTRPAGTQVAVIKPAASPAALKQGEVISSVSRSYLPSVKDLNAPKIKTASPNPAQEAGTLARNYTAEVISAVEEAKAAGRGYTHSAGSSPEETALKLDDAKRQLAQSHDGAIASMEKRIQNDLQKRSGLSQATIDEVKRLVRQAGEQHSTFVLHQEDPQIREYGKLVSELDKREAEIYKMPSEADRQTAKAQIDQSRKAVGDRIDSYLKSSSKPYVTAPPIKKPGFGTSRGYYKDLDRNMAIPKTENPSAHYLGKAQDTALRGMFGASYRKNPSVAPLLDGYYKEVFMSDINAQGREIQQGKEVMEARAEGDKAGETAAYEKRNQLLSEHKGTIETGAGGKEALTMAEQNQRLQNLAAEGIGAEDFGQMKVRPWYQEENMIGDLTHGENLMSSVTIETPGTGAMAVRDQKRFFLGAGVGKEEQSIGFLKYANNRLSEGDPNFKKMFIPMETFAKLEKEAIAADASHSVKSIKIREAETKIRETKTELSKLEQKLAAINKALGDGPDKPLEQAAEDVMAKIREIQETMPEFEKAAGGTAVADRRKQDIKVDFVDRRKQLEQIDHPKVKRVLELTKDPELTNLFYDMAFLDSRTGDKATNQQYYEYSGMAKKPQIQFDVDTFKDVNSKYSHATGDIVLHKVVEIAYKYFPDRVNRKGGEEFALNLENLSSKEALNLKKANRELAKYEFTSIGSGTEPEGTKFSGVTFTAALGEHGTAASSNLIAQKNIKRGVVAVNKTDYNNFLSGPK